MKKMIATVLSLGIILCCISCGIQSEVSFTTAEKSTFPAETDCSTETDKTETTDIYISETTEITESETDPVEEPTYPVAVSNDMQAIQVGKYITLRYNGNTANVKTKVEKGVGSKEIVTMTATMCGGFTFDGWSIGNAWSNGAPLAGKNETYTITANKPLTVFLNTSCEIYYYTDGAQKDEDYIKKQTASSVFYFHPSSLPDEGYFKKPGYQLTGYSTKPGGGGKIISVGARIPCYDRGILRLYCVFEKENDVHDFTMEVTNGKAKVLSYDGNDQTVVVPSVYENAPVVEIAHGAFRGKNNLERLVLSKNIRTVAPKAIMNCEKLHTLVISESIRNMQDNSLFRCPSFQNLVINALNTQVDAFFSNHGGKIDRLMWSETANTKNRIMIIGGSGCLFGYRSDQIRDAFHDQYEVINFGENAFISSTFYFDLIEDFARDGDIILWSPETGNYTNGMADLEGFFWQFRNDDYGFTQYIDFSNFGKFFGSFAWYLNKEDTMNTRKNDCMSPYITKYGDDIRPRKCQNRIYQYQFHYNVTYDQQKQMIEKLNAKGVRIFYSFATMQKTGMQKIAEEDILSYEKKITSFPGVVSISDWHDCVYEDCYFWDSPWHLTNEGAVLRTNQVIADLKKYIL